MTTYTVMAGDGLILARFDDDQKAFSYRADWNLTHALDEANIADVYEPAANGHGFQLIDRVAMIRTLLSAATVAADTPPAGHPYAAALWLLQRHPQLAELAARVLGVHGRDSQSPWLDLDLLADAINTCDDDQAESYALASAAAHAFSRLNLSEQAMLRLLATLGTCPVRFRVGMLRSFDQAGHTEAGHALLADWYAALRAS